MKMAETDVLLKLKFDVKEAEKQLDDLKQEVHDMGKDSSSKSNSNLMKDYEDKINFLESKVEQLNQTIEEFSKTSIKMPEINVTNIEQEIAGIKQQIQDVLNKVTDSKPINIPVDFDGENIVNQVNDIQHQIDVILEGNNETEDIINSALLNVQNQIGTTSRKVKELKEELEELSQRQIPTEEYIEVQKRVEKMSNQFDRLLIKQDEMKDLGKDSGPAWEALNVKMERLGQLIREDEAELQRLVEQNKTFTLGKDSEEYKKKAQQLEDMNNKLKVQLIKYQEIERRTSNIGENIEKFSEDTKKVTKTVNSGDSFADEFKQVGGAVKKVIGFVALLTLGVKGAVGIFNKLKNLALKGFAELEKSDVGKYKKQIEDLNNSIKTLQNSLAGAFEPIVTMVIPYIQKLVEWLTLAIDKMAQFIAAISGQKTYVKAIKQVGDAAEKAGNQAKRALGPLDNLNVLTSPSSGSDKEMFEEVAIPDDVFKKLDAIREKFDEIKQIAEAIIIEPFKEGFTSALGDWQSKVNSIKTDAESVKNSLISIFTNPELQAASLGFVRQTSETLGQLTGAGTRIGLNIGENVAGGTAQFLEENKDRISLDTAELITINTSTMEQLGNFAQAIGDISDAIGSESGQGLTASVENLGYTTETEFAKIQAKINRDTVSLITQPIIDNVEGIQAAIENLNLIITPLIDGMAQAVQQDSESTNLAYDTYIVPIIEDIKAFTSWFTENVLNFWNSDVAPWLQDVAAEASALWNEHIQPVLDEFKLTVGSVFAFVWDTIIKPVYESLKPAIIFIETVIWPMIKTTLEALWDQVRIVFNFIDLTLGGTLRTVRFVFDVIRHILTLDFEGVVKDVTSFIEDQTARWKRFIQFFVDFFQEKIDKSVEKFNTMKNRITGIIETIKGKFDEFKAKIQGVIDTISELMSAWKNGGIAGLIGEINDAASKASGSSTSSSSSSSVPGYASGQVIPPSMSRHLAVLGDNKQETEVVSPLSTMKEAMIEALSSSGMGGSGNQEIVLELDGREILRALVKQNNEYKKQHGGASALA